MIELQKELEQFHGTEHYYKASAFGSLKVTDGVQWLRNGANCFWLTDIIASVQPMLSKKGGTEFQVWTLKVNKKDNSAVARCTDGNEKELYTQKIGYTDFPFKEIVLYCTNDVVLLPGEY